MKKTKSIYPKVFLGLVVLIGIGLILVSEDNAYIEKKVSFRHDSDQLAAVLAIPKTPGPHTCLVLIHGDGAQNWHHDGGIYVFFQEFTKAGWCVMSWDKAGVGGSTGDWLSQSMSYRADEALAAIDYLRSRNDVVKDKIGLIGYSQAGWVLPLAASRSNKVAFIIPISAAVDVVEQGIYYKRNLWTEQGLSENKIAERLDYYKKYDTPDTYEGYLEWYKNNAPEGYGEPMSERRWGFDQMLGGVNARAALRKTTCPVLAIWGSYDLRVDPEKNRAIYEEELTRAGNTDFTLKIFNKANHSLIAMEKRQFTYEGPAYWWVTLKYIFLGKNSFAAGYFDLLTNWLEKRK